MIHFLIALFLVTTPPQASIAPPIYPNASCPIMGKPVSTRLFAETEKGRIFVCCKGCVPDILGNVEIAYRTAFPSDKPISNTKCPVTAKDITKGSPTIVLQGFEFRVHDADAARIAREESQIALAKLHEPKLVDVENKVCPVSGAATAKNAFVVIDGQVVRLSSPKVIEDVQKDPAMVLAKAKELRERQDKERAK